LSKNSPPDNFKRLDQAEIKAAMSDLAKDYPCIGKISLYRMKRDKDFPNDPKYVFVVVAPDPPPKLDRETDLAQNIIKYYNETYESCSHLYHVMEDFYRIEKLPENKLPGNYQEEWFWFSIEPAERIEDYEMVMDVKPLVLYERDDQPCSAPNTAETSTVEPTNSKDIDDFPENHNNFITLKGGYWAIKYRGKPILVQNLDRIRYIIHMLEYPNREFYVHELIGLVKGHNPIVNQDYSKMDAAQLEKEGLSLTELQLEHLSPEDARCLEGVAHNLWVELIEAEKLGREKHVKAKDKWDIMIKHLLQEYGVSINSSAKGPKFRYRPKWKNDIEKARSLVKKHVSNAIKGLRSQSPALAGYLDKHIHTGVKCVYRPDSDDLVKWVIHR
jgi:hypothetical protein